MRPWLARRVQSRVGEHLPSGVEPWNVAPQDGVKTQYRTVTTRSRRRKDVRGVEAGLPPAAAIPLGGVTIAIGATALAMADRRRAGRRRGGGSGPRRLRLPLHLRRLAGALPGDRALGCVAPGTGWEAPARHQPDRPGHRQPGDPRRPGLADDRPAGRRGSILLGGTVRHRTSRHPFSSRLRRSRSPRRTDPSMWASVRRPRAALGERRLAHAGLSQHAEALAGGHREADPVEGSHRPGSGRGHGEVTDLEPAVTGGAVGVGASRRRGGHCRRPACACCRLLHRAGSPA